MGAVILQGAALFPGPGEPLPAAPGRRAALERMDRLSGLALCATDLVLERAAAQGVVIDRERTGVIVGTAFGCHQNDESYYRGLLLAEGRLEGASPRLFVYTLPSSPAGEIAIRHGLRGPGLCEVSGRTAGLDALAAALDVLRSGAAAAMLVCAADVSSPLLSALEGEQTGEGAVALLLAPPGAGAGIGRVGPAVSAFCPRAPDQALRQVLRLIDAGPGEFPEVRCDPATGTIVAPLLQPGRSPSTDRTLYPQAGACGALHALWAGGTAPVLVLSSDRHGHAAGAMWSARGE